jgi:signal transduction histidine kinase
MRGTPLTIMPRGRSGTMSEQQRSAREPRPAIAAPVLQAILDALTVGVVVVDRRGVVRYANVAVERLLDRPPGSLTGTPFELEHALPRRRTGEPIKGEVEIDRHGRPMVVELVAIPFRWEGKPAWLVSLGDVTEQRQSVAAQLRQAREEAARAEAEAAQHARDEYLATVAHELKTPVTRLRLAVQLALRHLERGAPFDLPRLHTTLEALSHDSRRLARVVKHLLDLPRLEAGTFALRPAPADLVDAEHLGEAIASVLDNALRFSPDGGPVEITLERGPSASAGPPPGGPPGEVVREGQETARIIVRDYGVGMPREQRARLFERFYRGHSASHLSGLGVGLYVCRRIIELHGGRMEASFPERGGAEIVLALPLLASAIAPTVGSGGERGSRQRSAESRSARGAAGAARQGSRAYGTDHAGTHEAVRSIEGPSAARSSRSPARQPRPDVSRGLERGGER